MPLIFKLQAICGCTCVLITVHTYMHVHVFKYTWKKKSKETKTSVWYEGYVCHKLMCFQFFMPEVIITQTILKHRYINFNDY